MGSFESWDLLEADATMKYLPGREGPGVLRGA